MDGLQPNMFTVTMLVASMIAVPVMLWYILIKKKIKTGKQKSEPTPAEKPTETTQTQPEPTKEPEKSG